LSRFRSKALTLADGVYRFLKQNSDLVWDENGLMALEDGFLHFRQKDELVELWVFDVQLSQKVCSHRNSPIVDSLVSKSSISLPQKSHLLTPDSSISQLIELVSRFFHALRAESERRASPWLQISRRRPMRTSTLALLGPVILILSAFNSFAVFPKPAIRYERRLKNS
jgi:hypothetical protein